MSEEKVKELEEQLTAEKAKNDKLDERAKKFEGQMVDFQKQLETFKGVDLDALKAAKEENEILKRKTSGINEDKFSEAVEAGIQKQREELQKQLDDLTNANKDLSSKVTDYEVVGKSMEVLADKIKDDPITKPFIKDLLRQNLRKEGEQLVVYNGEDKVFSKADVSKPMEASEYYGIIQEQYPSAFKDSVPAGTKTNNERVGAKIDTSSLLERAKNPESAKSLTAEERIEASKQLYAKHRTI